MKEIICTVCPNGCRMTVDSDLYEISVTGNECERGEKYAISEYTNPVRQLTVNIAVEGGELPVVSAKTDGAVSLKKIMPIARLAKKLSVKAPVNAGDVLFDSLLGERIIATRSVAKVENNDKKQY